MTHRLQCFLFVALLCGCHPVEKRIPESATTEEVLRRMDRAMDEIQAFHSNRVAQHNERIHQLAYVVAIAGYCAATNGVPFERISNSVYRIVVDHFEIK